eukprot:7326074-Prymnesium_polylepis.1
MHRRTRTCRGDARPTCARGGGGALARRQPHTTTRGGHVFNRPPPCYREAREQHRGKAEPHAQKFGAFRGGGSLKIVFYVPKIDEAPRRQETAERKPHQKQSATSGHLATTVAGRRPTSAGAAP